MTQAEFVEVTSEIEGFFGKELDTYQRKIWYEELKNLTKERYRQISRECYKNLKFMPKLADITELNKNLQKPQQQIDETTYECNICNGIGIVLYTKIIEGYPYQYGARCSCKNSAKWNKKIPSIQEVGLYEVS